MGILNKILFWRKEDDFDFDKLTSQEIGNPTQQTLDPFADDPSTNLNGKSLFPDQSIGTKNTITQPERSSSFSTFQQQQGIGSVTGSKDLDLINSKLDTLKAMLQGVEQRLNSIEQNMKGEQQKQKLW